MFRSVWQSPLTNVLAVVLCSCIAGSGWCQEPSPEEATAPEEAVAPEEAEAPSALPDEAEQPRVPERPVMGRVTDLNPLRGYIELQSLPAGTSRVVVVTEDTEMTKPGTITLAELQVGDRVRVSGIPLQLRAASINVQPPPEAPGTDREETGDATEDGEGEAEPADEAPQGAATEDGDGDDAPETPTEFTGPPGERPERAEREGRPRRPEGTVSVSGVVESTEPFVIGLSDGVSVTLTLTEETTILKPKPATIEDLATGDFMWASGKRNADDLLEAAQVRVIPPDEAMARLARSASPMMGSMDGRRSSAALRGGPGRGGFGGFGDRGFRDRGGRPFGGRGFGEGGRGGGRFGGRGGGEGAGGPARFRERPDRGSGGDRGSPPD